MKLINSDLNRKLQHNKKSLGRVLSSDDIESFQKTIYQYYESNKRAFSWRETRNAYFIVVSEIMLQQTQTERVKEKYAQFIATFPTLESLAAAPIHEVIAAWQGLGYNRRALALKEFAAQVVNQYAGVIPQEPDILIKFKGIGPATAASIAAFAFNKPTVFIETNVRAVFIHHYFNNKSLIGDSPIANSPVADSEIYSLVDQTLDRNNPRIWYYALMDYGVMLKKKFKNPSRKSAHYVRQSKFEGSDRQVRGLILKMLVAETCVSADVFFETIARTPERIERILDGLEDEGFIKHIDELYSLV